MSTRPFVVTGANGNVGRHAVSELVAAGATVRAFDRNPPRTPLPAGVEPVVGDITDPDALGRAVDGSAGVLLVFPSGDADDAAPAVVETVTARTGRLVYLSAQGVADAEEGRVPETGIVGSHRRLESLVREHAAEWTLLRLTGLATNTLAWTDQVRGGVVRWPYARAARSLMDPRDVAAAAARVLTGSGHEGRTHVLSGPQVLTQAEQVAEIGAALGRDVRFVEVAPADAESEMVEGWGWPREMARAVLGTWAAMVEHPEPVTGTFAELVGRAPVSLRTWAADHADLFR